MCIYPAGATENQKRVIRKKSKKFSIKNGELYYSNVKRGRGSSKVSFWAEGGRHEDEKCCSQSSLTQ